MKTTLKLAEMLDHCPAWLRDAATHVAKDSGLKTDELTLSRHSHSEKARVNGLDPKSRQSLKYVSARTQDRDDEIVIPQAIDLKEFRKYMHVLVNHNYSLLPVGSDEFIEADDYGIKALTNHADTGEGTLANVIWHLVSQGHLKSSSIGFVPTSYTKPGSRDWDHVANQLQSSWKEFDKGRAEKSVSRIITGGVLLEHSFVSVPCNADAEMLSVVKGMGLDGRVARQLGWEMKDGVLVAKAEQPPAEKVPCACDECGYVADAVPGSKCPECKTGDMKPKGKEKAVEVKGDVPGHEFHGNQYSGGGGGSSDKDDEKYNTGAQKARDRNYGVGTRVATPKGSYGKVVGFDRDGSFAQVRDEESGKVTSYHNSDLQPVNEEGDSEEEEKSFHSHAVEKPNPHMPGGSFSACVLIMEDKGHDNESAKKICGALQADAGGKGLDGLNDVEIKAVAETLIEMKGDLPGHEFHGNQYSGGGGSGGGRSGFGDKGERILNDRDQAVKEAIKKRDAALVESDGKRTEALDRARKEGNFDVVIDSVNRQRAKDDEVAHDQFKKDMDDILRKEKEELDKLRGKKTMLKALGIPCTCDECGAEDECAPGSPCQEADCGGVMRVSKKMEKEYTPEITVVKPSPQIKVLYAPPDPALVAKGVSDAVERALSRHTGKIL